MFKGSKLHAFVVGFHIYATQRAHIRQKGLRSASASIAKSSRSAVAQKLGY